MEITFGLENVTHEPETALTIGSFDGVHLGHQKILKRLTTREETVSTVITFDPHPQTVIKSQSSAPPLLTTIDERIQLIEKSGAAKLIIIKFTSEFAKMPPEKFIKEILIDSIGMKYLYAGKSHQFGRGRKGDIKLLKDYAKQFDFKLEIIDPVSRFNQLVSSTHIRRLLSNGDVLTAWRCLGRPYYLRGKVIQGDGRGKKLGFPTANLELDEKGKLIPPEGIYATVAEIDGVRMPSVSHFGARPTFKNAAPSIETHVIGYHGNLYGNRIHLGFVDRMRDIAAFPSVIELVRQLILDRAFAKRRLAELGFSHDARMRIQRYGTIIQ